MKKLVSLALLAALLLGCGEKGKSETRDFSDDI